MIVSTFRDNPFLEQSIIEAIEKIKFFDSDLYQIYNLGIWSKLKGLIYPDFEVVKELPPSYLEETYGLDFGYSHPSSFVRTLRTHDSLYLQELIYEPGLLINELASRILSHNPRRIFCDSAEPRSIAELRKRGVNATPSKKGKDSVKQGINYIKQHKIYITEDSLGLIEEARRYKWAEDLQGRLTEQPVKEYDDSWDAVRYSINRSLGSKMRLI